LPIRSWAVAFAIAACATVATIGRTTEAAPLPAVTFSKDIAPVLFNRCGSCHHPQGPAPFSLLTYSDARPRATSIALATSKRHMPPWKAEPGYGEFIGQQALTDAEIAIIQNWVADGALEGNRRDLPSQPEFTQGWQLGTPDLVVTQNEPYLLRADGPDFSRVFVFPVPTTTLRYVKGVEFRSGSPNVVHHANIRVDRTPASRGLDDQDPAPGYQGVLLHSAVYPDGHFLGWTPGQVAPLLPKGLAWRLNPGTDLVVEIHLVPDGKIESIRPTIGLYFTDDAPSRTPEMLRLGVQSIDIAAGEKAYTINDSFALPVDVEVHAVQPHAHYRAREIRGVATLPDGSTRPLIYIKDWDFHWQHVYRYVAPLILPKGTTLSMQYTYDNSIENRRNPQQPPQRVLWGQRTTDEMGDLWVQMLTRDERDRQVLSAAIQSKEMMEDVAGFEIMTRRDPSNAQLHDDAGLLYQALGRTSQAAIHFEASLKLKPDSAAAHFNLGTVLTLMGRLDEALARYRRALEINPGYAQAENNLGNVLLLQGHTEQALEHMRAALRLDPANAEAHYNVGSVVRGAGDLREAIGQFRQAVTRRPDFTPAVVGLAWLLATAPDASLREPGEAVRLAEHAVDLTERREPGVLDILAAAYASAGQFDRALSASQEALDLKPSDLLAAAIQRRRALYVQRKGYVGP
jgi:tetratricopeptide (TPR) repeat protein/mono/diheme cytochrome c family protein